jgi:tRNA threonylcarbamoyladenosine biosynthesis protein TsaE
MSFELASPQQTEAIGRALADLLAGGDVIALQGDLGAGKTTLVAALVAHLGGQASSPTFSLVNEYALRPLTIWHIDLYRLDHEHELAALGLDDIIGNRAGVCVIEWADKFDCLPEAYLQLNILHTEAGTSRQLSIRGVGPRGSELANSLANLRRIWGTT